MSYHRTRILDPRDPDAFELIEVEYEAVRGRDQLDVGYRASTEYLLDPLLLQEFSAEQRADIEEQIHRRHGCS